MSRLEGEEAVKCVTLRVFPADRASIINDQTQQPITGLMLMRRL